MKTRIVILLLTAVLASISTAGAQDFRRRYSEAKAYFDDRRYDKSMDAFRELMVYDKANPYAEYAGFYFALSAYHQNMRALARTTLLRLDSLYPGWSNSEEIRYWLALLYFEEGEPFHAIRILSRIPPSASVVGLKRKHVRELKDPEVLRMLLEDSRDTVVAVQLVRVLIDQKSSESVTEARELVKVFNLNESELLPLARAGAENGERRISVLFPFLTKTLGSSPGLKRNQYALDLFQGLKLAVAQLKRSGRKIELAAYDTERNPVTAANLLKLPELSSSDVVVGPLFSEEFPVVKEWAARNNVTTIHPATSSSDFIQDNPSGLLFQPSYLTIGRKSADFAASLKLPGVCYVFFENTPKDSLMAFGFRERAGEIGLRIKEFRRVTKASAAVITTVLGAPKPPGTGSRQVVNRLSQDSVGLVFVASDSEVIYTKAINSINAKDETARLLGLETWLEKPTADLMRMEELQVAFISPNFYDPTSPEYKSFQKSYLALHGVPPSAYARTGFELGHFLARKWAENPESFSPITDGGFDRGLLGGGIDFAGQNDNQVVPITGFSEGKLIRLF